MKWKGLEDECTIKGTEWLKPWEEKKLGREFLGRGRMAESNFGDHEQRDVLLVVHADRTLGTADAPTRCSACSWRKLPMLVARHCSLSLLLQWLRYWVQLTGRLQLVLGGRPGHLRFEHCVGGPRSAADACCGVGRRPRRGAGGCGGSGSRGRREFCVLGCSRAARLG